MRLRHKRCSSPVFLDVAPLYIIKAPSFGVGPNGVSLDMVEICVNKHKDFPNFYCTECEKTISLKGECEDILGECSVCGKYVPIKTLENCSRIAAICTTCKEKIISQSDEVPESIKLVRNLTNMGKEKLVFKSILTMLQSNIVV